MLCLYFLLQPDELSFEEDDVLYVTANASDPNWLQAKCGDRTGIVPANYGGSCFYRFNDFML